MGRNGKLVRNNKMWADRLLSIGWKVEKIYTSEKHITKANIRCCNCGYEKEDVAIYSVYNRKTKCPYCIKHICSNSDCNKEFYISKEVPHATLQRNSNGSYRYFCYDCVPIGSDADFQRMRVKFNRERVNDEYGTSCKACGYSKCTKALDFHHLEADKKEFSPANIIQSLGMDNWEKIKKELDKCILLCSNCHKEVHAGELDLDEIIGGK